MVALPAKSNGNFALVESWVSTCPPAQGLAARMEDDTADLIAQLCTGIGMTMEDASEDALTIGAMDATERADAIARLEVASDRISRLICAVTALVA